MMMAAALVADGHLPVIKEHTSPDYMFRVILVTPFFVCPVTRGDVRDLVDSEIIRSRLQPRDDVFETTHLALVVDVRCETIDDTPVALVETYLARDL